MNFGRTQEAEARRAQIVELRRQGLSFAEIAEQVGTSRAWCANVVRERAPSLSSRRLPRPRRRDGANITRWHHIKQTMLRRSLGEWAQAQTYTVGYTYTVGRS